MVAFSIEDYVYHTLAAKGSGELCLKYIFSFGAFTRMPLLNRSGYPNHFKVLKFVTELTRALKKKKNYLYQISFIVCFELVL